MKKQIYSTIIIFLITGLFLISDRVSQALAGETVIYAYDFEGGWGTWYADNGVWQVGVPGDPGPESAYYGNNVAGTVLTANYPDYTSSRLISPSIQLPYAGVNEEIHLRFWHWMGIGSYDRGYVQISWEESGGWSTWETVSHDINRNSRLWSYSMVDLTGYAGKKVRIAFFLSQDSFFGGVGPGWYIDNVSVTKSLPIFRQPQSFELGWDGWYADNGVWEVGVPGDPGPDTAYSGNNVAGTVLTDNYPDYTSSRLISPSIQLPYAGVNEEIHLRFWHWMGIGSYDRGYVQISWEESGGWSVWETVGPDITGTSPLWSYSMVDLTSYAGKKVRIAFFLSQPSWSGSVGPGWYIDDVEIRFGGSLKVNILPQEAVDAGAQWRVTGGAWRNSGDTILSLATGIHTVEFKNVAGWIRPAKRSVNIEYQKITTITETYLFNSSVGLPGVIMLLLDD